MAEQRKNEMKAVFALTEREDKTYWTKIGVAFDNRDGSITCKLDALPVSGVLQLRPEEERDRDDRERGEREREGRERGGRR